MTSENKLADAAAKAAAARNELRKEIHRAHARGMSLRAIAKEVGMSHEQVRRLTK